MGSPVLKKHLGQHHLRDPGLCRPLVEYLTPQGRRVIEVGVGGGVLTSALLSAGARVRAWELDLAWAAAARARLGGDAVRQGRLAIVVGDALELPWGRVPAPFLAAGNLPYNVATPIIDRLLDQVEGLERAAFLVQLEVAQRLVAEPGSGDYGALTVLTRARATARLLGRVRPGSFVPPPKVESAFVGLEPRVEPMPARRFAALRELVHTAFGQRRKTLRNALSGRWPRPLVAAAIEGAGVPADARAERLTLEEFEALLDTLSSV